MWLLQVLVACFSEIVQATHISRKPRSSSRQLLVMCVYV